MNRNTLLGGVAIVLFASILLLAAFFAATLYRERYVQIRGDGMYYAARVATILQRWDKKGLLPAIQEAWQRESEDDWTLLPYLTSIALAPILPRDYTALVILHAPWFFALALSLYVFFLKRGYEPFVAFLLATPLLLVTHPLAELPEGLTDLSVNLYLYTLGITALVWIVASDSFHHRKACFLAGFFLGLLTLGRPHGLGVVGIASLPFFLAPFRREKKDAWPRAIRGIGILLGVWLLVGGWWFLPQMGGLIHYIEKWWGRAGLIGGKESTFFYLHYWAEVLFKFPQKGFVLLLLPASWIFGQHILARKSIIDLFRDIHWPVLWMVFSPLLIMVAFKSTASFYIWPFYFGLYLGLLEPMASDPEGISRRTLQHPIVRWILVAIIVFATTIFLIRLYQNHQSPRSSVFRAPLLTACHAMKDHAIANERSEIRIAIAIPPIWRAALKNFFLFDIPFFAFDRPNVPLQLPSHRIVVRLTVSIAEDGRILDLDHLEKIYQEFLSDSDYILAFAPEVWERSPTHGVPPPSEALRLLHQRLLTDPSFELLTSPAPLLPNYPFIVLARR